MSTSSQKYEVACTSRLDALNLTPLQTGEKRNRVSSPVSVARRLIPVRVFAGQAVGINEVQDDIWLVSFMDYDLGYFDLETRVLEALENPFGPKVLPMSQVRCVTHVPGLDPLRSGAPKGTILELFSAISCQR
jgi:hypothetical protein